MKCPVCGDVTLAISERQGIEIDYCPECRGVWLDRGELDKIIERSGAEQEPPREARREPPRERRDEYERRKDDDYYKDKYHYKKKKKSFLSEIFDFD